MLNKFISSIEASFENYLWSSYLSILSDAPAMLKRKEVLDWFGGKENFVKTHRAQVGFYYDNPFSIE